jgi:hypothetical protein
MNIAQLVLLLLLALWFWAELVLRQYVRHHALIMLDNFRSLGRRSSVSGLSHEIEQC